jgi:hypothetical protein
VTDERLRDLERQADSSVEARARLLVERVRAGDLAADRLLLAAYLGDEAARLAAEGERWEPPTGGLREWLGGLVRFGKEPRVRTALALCDAVAVAPRGEVEPTRPWRRIGDPDVAAAAVAAVRAWLDGPSVELRDRCHSASEAARASYPGALRLDPAWSAFCQAAGATAHLAAESENEAPMEVWVLDAARRVADDAALRAAVVAALLPWALTALVD